jgi:thiamine-phosphate pyrophosphorylase
MNTGAQGTMRIVVVSPESVDAREVAAMGGLFAAGLDRYHVRKPSWSREDLQSWLAGLPEAWRPRIVLHQHHDLASGLGLGGSHDRDNDANSQPGGRSRSCHGLASLRRHLPSYEYILFGPVYPSLTKTGYGPAADFPWDGLRATLRERSETDARVLAIGGITAGRLGRCRELGFDGAAVLGSVWNKSDPVAAYAGIREAAARLEDTRHAA